jgi:serine/threonine-protein kinase
VRSDIYALGVMVYEMLVGKYPFEANTAWEWASKHMTEAPRPIETQALGQHVPERMRHAITRALAKNKDERFSTVKEFFEAFSGTGLPNQTAVMNQANQAANAQPQGGADPYASARADGAPGGGRAKTEMGAPVMDGGPPAGAMTPPYGGAGMGPGMGTAGPSGPGSAPAMVPAGPAHQPAKKGGNGLIIGLAALAVLLIGGGVLALVLSGGKPKVVVTDPLDLDGSASATASAAPVESATAATSDADAAVAAVAPLGGVVAVAAHPGTGTGSAKPVPTPSAKPAPTPQPKVDPPICAKARAAKIANRPTAGLLEAQCRQAGGTP